MSLFRKAVLGALAGMIPTGILTPAHADLPVPGDAFANPVAAEFRGCDASGWCRFRIAALESTPGQVYRVRPDGVHASGADDADGRAVRDRLNALMSSMIHQHKRIVLYDLRDLGDGVLVARITVNEADLASDPVLLELDEKNPGGQSRRDR